MRGKKFFAWLLTAALVLGMFPVPAMAAEAGGFEYEVNGDAVTITGYTGSGIDVVIPSVIDGKTVTSIGHGAFYNCTSLKSVEIPDSVTSIVAYAFDTCSALTSVKIPGNVTTISDHTFTNCHNLTEIELPDSVTSIGEEAFSYCTSLASIKIPNGVTSIGNIAFYDCTSLASIKIPNGVTSIGNDAFSNCTSLESAEIPDSVTSIGSGAFSYCTSLASIKIPNGVETIKNDTFRRCSALESVEIPDSVTSIDSGAFSDCVALRTIEIPYKVTSIGFQAFNYCPALELIVLPAGCDTTNASIPREATQMKYTVDSDGTVTITSVIPGSNGLNAELLPATIGGKPFKVENCSHQFGYSHVDNGDGMTHTETCVLCKQAAGNTAPHYGVGTCSLCQGRIAAEVTLTQASYEYTGVAIIPDVIVTQKTGDSPLQGYWGDYTVTCSNNVNTGTATVHVSIRNGETISKTFTITPATPTITWGTQGPLAYTGQPAAITPPEVTLVNNETFRGTISYSYAEAGGSAFADGLPAGVGTYTVRAAVAASGNYTAASETVNIEIQKAGAPTANTGTIYIQNDAAQTYTFDLAQLLPTLDAGAEFGTTAYALGGISLGNYYTGGAKIEGGRLELPIQAVSGGAGEQIGTMTVTITSPNYQPMTATIKVCITEKIPVTITGVTAQSATYNGKPQQGYTGSPTNEDGYSGGYTIAYNTADGRAPTDTGSYTVTIRPSDAGYTGSVTLSFTIEKATVTVKADDKTATTGDAAPALTYTVTGLADGERLKTAPTVVYVTTPDMSRAGTTAIKASGAEVPDGGNYNVAITYVDGTLTVNSPVVMNYTVAFNSQGGSAVSSQTVTAGCKVTKPSDPTRSGYNFGGWYKESACTTVWNFDTDTVTGDITLYAKWTQNTSSVGGGDWYTPPTYPPTVEKPSEGGTVTVSPSRPSTGDKVTVRPKPDSGYEVEKVTVTDKNGRPVTVTKNPDGTYSFTQPNGTVKVEVIYKSTETLWSNPFRDVTETAWYYEAVRYVSENGLMNGYSDGRFGSDDNLSRAQLAQILFNREGRPGVNYLLQFGDVPGEAWYTEAVRWATSQGIVGGYGNGSFGPNDPITREQLAVMLWRYSGSPAATNKELHFADMDESSGYALEALRWAVEKGVINGKSGGILDPRGLATRAETAQILKNFLEDK